MGQETIHLSVVIPAYNEAGRIGQTLDRLSEYLRGRHGTSGVEIIVVDDGSRDGTIEVVEKFSARASTALPST